MTLVEGVFPIYVTYESRVDVKMMSIDGEPGKFNGNSEFPREKVQNSADVGACLKLAV